MSTTTVRISQQGLSLIPDVTSVSLAAGDAIEFVAPASTGVLLCMTPATAAIFSPAASPGMEIPAAGSVTLQFGASPSGSPAIVLQDSQFACPSTISCGNAAPGVLSICSAEAGYEGPEPTPDTGT